jgi:hypothetical protein
MEAHMPGTLKPVDHSALKANQIVIIILALFAFIFSLPWVSLVTGLIMAIGTIIGKPGFLFLYSGIVKPLGLLSPEVIKDNPEPHRFAQGFGATVLIGGSAAVLAGAPVAGWSLVWLVVVLASLNAFAGFCAGCFVYYQLSKLKLPGFKKLPPEGSFPGFKPKASASGGA